MIIYQYKNRLFGIVNGNLITKINPHFNFVVWVFFQNYKIAIAANNNKIGRYGSGTKKQNQGVFYFPYI